MTTESSTAPPELRWPDPRAHSDGELVRVSGTVVRVVLEATATATTWAELDVVVEPGLPRLRCVAFPSALERLDGHLEPGRALTFDARVSHRGPGGFEVHVRDWTFRA